MATDATVSFDLAVKWQAAVSEARRDGTVFVGGERLSDKGMERGFYVEPTVVGNLPTSHRLFQDELFAPFTAVHAVDSLDEALALANDNVYGLTAGVYSNDPIEVQRFLDEIEAGVLYVNRRAGATTGAWPGVRSRRLEGLRFDRQDRLSIYYVAGSCGEQSHTVVDDRCGRSAPDDRLAAGTCSPAVPGGATAEAGAVDQLPVGSEGSHAAGPAPDVPAAVNQTTIQCDAGRQRQTRATYGAQGRQDLGMRIQAVAMGLQMTLPPAAELLRAPSKGQ